MPSFINDDFLLETQAAKDLYHGYAEDLPIIDYHCHLPPEEIAQDLRWENISQIWLYSDHYKWRAMRTHGVDERFITGPASDREKYNKWSEAMPYLLRNPLYHWTHLELARYFDVKDVLLNPQSSELIWNKTKEMIQKPHFSARGLITQSKVEALCTTDDPIDTLEDHLVIAKDGSFSCNVMPTWRPDQGMNCDNVDDFNTWLDQLAEVSNVEINSFDAYLRALKQRHDFFHACGCRLSDHGLEKCYGEDFSDVDVNRIFEQLRSGSSVSIHDSDLFKSAMMYHFGVMDHEKGWTQQLHYGVIRNNNERNFKQIGRDCGFDSIGDASTAQAMAAMLNRLDREDKLPKTIIYNLNPSHNEMVATMLGNFQDGSCAGKIQMGSGWWFLDQKDGMERQMECLSQLGMISHFVGMLTDSRSFLSYTRHEYFRRILCNLYGSDMAKGLIPNDLEHVGSIIANICYHNAKGYFGFQQA